MSDGQKPKNFLPFLTVQIVLVLIVFLAVVYLFPGEWNLRRWVGLLLMSMGAVGLFTARFQLGNSFAVTAQARELVTRGVYSKIRNPIYVFSSLLILGVFIIMGKAYLFLPFAGLVVVQTWRAHKEAKVLEAKFGEQYRAYRRQTWF